MLIDAISNPGFALLKLALDATSMRHQVIANNIANSHTENYQPLRVSFEEQLQHEMTASGSILKNDISTRVTPQIEPEMDATAGVAVDQELAQLTQNFIHYQALLKALNGKLELTNLALNDGRRSL